MIENAEFHEWIRRRNVYGRWMPVVLNTKTKIAFVETVFSSVCKLPPVYLTSLVADGC